jgi:hypothetical protein
VACVLERAGFEGEIEKVGGGAGVSGVAAEGGEVLEDGQQVGGEDREGAGGGQAA